MNQFWAYLTVFVAAAIPWLEVLLVVPAGIVAGLAPIPTSVVGAAGNAASLVPLVLAGDRLRSWWRARRQRRRAADTTAGSSHPPGDHDDQDHDDHDQDHGHDGHDQAAGRGGRARRLYERFGLPGLALLGPLLTGVHVAAIVGLAAGSPRRPTLGWLLGGILLWTVIAATATVLGLEAFVDPDDLPDLFGQVAIRSTTQSTAAV